MIYSTLSTTIIMSSHNIPPSITRNLPSIDFGITYIIELDAQPVFFVEIKPPGHFNNGSGRTQMRDRFCDLRHHTPTRRLHGISAMGQRLAFYSMNTRTGAVVPKQQSTSKTSVTNTVPEKLVGCRHHGHQRFMQVVNDVKAMVEAL